MFYSTNGNLFFSFLLGCISRYYLALSSCATEGICPKADARSVHSETRDWPTNGLGKHAVEYMESIVHPAMLAHPYPSNILIVGGAKEVVDVQAFLTGVLHHKSVEKVHMVESVVSRTPAEVYDGNVTCNSSDPEETIVEYVESLESILQQSKNNEINLVFTTPPLLILSFCCTLMIPSLTFTHINMTRMKSIIWGSPAPHCQPCKLYLIYLRHLTVD
jgi:hypothetical protein